jgi:hypothetical protein
LQRFLSQGGLRARRRIAEMSELEEIEERSRKLLPADLAKFREWFVEFDHLLWDRRIEADSRARKPDKLVAEAKRPQ